MEDQVRLVGDGVPRIVIATPDPKAAVFVVK
jgi:hypothetical protein